MAKKVGVLIKEARTGAGLTQEQLARKIKGISADDISRAERGEKELTQTVLKEIAKATGVTQKSLIDASKGTSSAKTSSSAKKTTAKTTAAKKPAAKTASSKTAAAKKTTAKKTTAKKTTSSSAFKISTQEKKLITAYRAADDRVKAGVNLMLLGTESLATENGAGDMLSALMNGVKDLLGR